jgi:hypothetical protein
MNGHVIQALQYNLGVLLSECAERKIPVTAYNVMREEIERRIKRELNRGE